MLSPATAAAVLLPLWATQAWAADVMVTDDVTSFNQLADDSDGFPRQTFRSSPVVAPVLHVNAWNKSLTDDGLHLFIGNNMNPVGHGAGPMIFSAADLSLVYADQSWGNNYHSEPQTIGGEPHLTFWASEDGDVCVVMDSAYKVRYRVYAVEPHRNDMHDLHITDEGTAVFTTHRPLQFDCSRWGGPADCTIQDTGFQEVDLETGEALFSWFAADHWDPDDSHARFEPDDFGLDADRNGRYDLSHNNGARKTADGHYLVSSRHYWHVQLVNGSSGEPVWTFGGNRNDFRDLSDGRATNIAWQHNPRLFHNDGDPDHVVQLSLFDNHAESQGDCGDDCHARGLHVELDTRAMTARLVREYPHPDRLDALAMGGMQIIPGSGNALAGWGWTPSIVEYSPDGEVALDIQKGRVGGGRQSDMFAYRAFKAPWSGRPTWPPSMALDKDEGAVYVSWNGATDVAAWRVYTADRDLDQIANRGDPIAESARDGFETSIAVPADSLARYVVVVAVDKDGRVLGQTPTFDAEQDVVEQEDDAEADEGSQEDDSKMPHSTLGLAGSAMAVVAVGGSIFAAVHYYRRWRAQGGSASKYMPVLTRE